MLGSQRALFDIPREVAYLNAASWSPLPRAVQEAGPTAAFTVPALVATYRKDSPTSVKGAVIETLGWNAQIEIVEQLAAAGRS